MSNFFLTQEDAKRRAEAFASDPDYKLYLHLEKGENYHGLMSCNFALKDTNKIFLDFNSKALIYFKLNDHEWTKEQITANFKDGFIHFPAEHLHKGDNTFTAHFENTYSNDGNGLHSYTDLDGAQYGYCQTEPYCCNRIFPVFDQPDIKGSLTFLINAPKEWVVISNTNSEKSTPAREFADDHPLFALASKAFANDFTQADHVAHLYNKTPHISSYLFAFAFGPFKEIKNEDKTTVPMSIYCRVSLYKYALEQQSKIFVFPKEGIKFYEKFFRTKYPFEKYDMVFCPEYTVGAMEYPGIITFNDNLIIRDVPTVIQYTTLGKVNLHELAHMWFGNLVTLKWWNDLWLNESFADFACYLCGHEIEKYLDFPISDSMTMMCIRKNWGYNEDQMITTHPIACEVANTSKAESIFDGITYSKGASVLKQLYFLLGHDCFSENLGRYFQKYSWKNATLFDFLGELATSSRKDHPAYDLTNWNKTWIETAGLNVIECQWNKNSNKMIIKQSSALPEHNTLRYHKIKIAFLDGACKPIYVKEVLLDPKPETEITFEVKEFKAVLPNYEDWDFVKLNLDHISLDFLEKNLSKLDKLNQMVVIRAFYEMVRDGNMRATEFIQTMIDHYLPYDNDLLTLSTVLGYLEVAREFIPPSFSHSYTAKIFNRIHQNMKSEKSIDKLKVYKTHLISCAETESQIDILKSILEENYHEFHLDLNLKDKWRILLRIYRSKKYSKLQKRILRNYLATQDKTELTRYYSFTIEAMTADRNEMRAIWNEITSPNRKISYQDIEYIIDGFFDGSKDENLKKEYFEIFYNDFPTIANRDPKEIGKVFLKAHHWTYDPKLAIIRLEEMLQKVDASKEFHRIAIRKEVDMIKRKLKAFRLYSSDQSKNIEFVFSSEQVSEGHPDKMCDLISDSIVDAVLSQDPNGKAGIETLIKNNNVIIAGETNTTSAIDLEKIVRARLEKIGYYDENYDFNPKTCVIQNLLDQQSREIANSVHINKSEEEVGAGDQGLMMGYATDETDELMPLTLVYATKILMALKEGRVSGKYPWMRPDAKSQVCIRYSKDEKGNITPLFVENVLVSTQHTRDITTDRIYEIVKKEIVQKVIDSKYLNEHTRYIINPSGSFVIGGPKGDAGVTGRKIIADTYGGWGGHGGGAFSGKDPTKVDRSGAYVARWIAKSLVKGEYCSRCLVQVSYAIGLAEPLSLYVDTFGTAKKGLNDQELVKIVKRNFDLRPGMIIKELDLKKPIYSENCTYGHFMHPEMTWENPKQLK
jgi:aminopeptidase N